MPFMSIDGADVIYVNARRAEDRVVILGEYQRIMRRSHRLLFAVGLVAGGTTIALVLRGQTDSTPPRASLRPPKSAESVGPVPLEVSDEPTQPAHLSGKIEADTTSAAPEKPPIGSNDAQPPVAPPPTVMEEHWRPSMRTASFKPDDSRAPAPPPQLPKPKPPLSPAARVVVHRIVDGDTLASLAQRYLGSSERFREIFEANHERLLSPDLLPIGAELRIPVSGTQTEMPAIESDNAQPLSD